ncbi:MAG: hypothetical protein ACLTZT_03295 [Butyricimonas faecalis]
MKASRVGLYHVLAILMFVVVDKRVRSWCGTHGAKGTVGSREKALRK